MSLPSTIRNPEAFNASLPAGFDGAVDWAWMLPCFAPGDTPMDLDCFKERRGQFLVVETKDPGKRMPKGQAIAFERLHRLGPFTLMLIWGKREPEHGIVWWAKDANPKSRATRFQGPDEAQEIVRRWYRWATERARR